MNRFAVYLDYQKVGDLDLSTAMLPRTFITRLSASVWLGDIMFGSGLEAIDMWEVPERDLPHDYQFMTYYVAGYDEG